MDNMDFSHELRCLSAALARMRFLCRTFTDLSEPALTVVKKPADRKLFVGNRAPRAG